MHLSLQSLFPLLFLLYLDLRYRENDLIILPDLSYVIIPDPSLPPCLPSCVHAFTHSLGILFPPPIPVLPHTVLMYVFKVHPWAVSLLPTCVLSFTKVSCVLFPIGSRSYSSVYLQWLLSAACSAVCDCAEMPSTCASPTHHHYQYHSERLRTGPLV